jgi:predicted porin
MAQVTISGTAGYGYQSTKAASVKASGFGVDTAAITFSASEDIGGGLKAAASMTVAGLERSTSDANGENMTLSLSGGFGQIRMGAIEIGSGIRGLAQAGAPVNNMEGEILPSAADSDIVQYSTPSMGGLVLGASLTEGNDGTGLVNGWGKGLASGQARATTVDAAYTSGPFAAKVDATSYSNGVADSRYRVSASFDLGVAKIGAGYESTKLNAGTNNSYAMFGVNLPMGPVSVGAVFIKADENNVGEDGYSIGASYSLSKRTSIISNYSSYDSGSNSDTKFKTIVYHSF